MKDVNHSIRRAGTMRNADIGAVLPVSHTAPVIEPADDSATTRNFSLNYRSLGQHQICCR